MIDNKEELEKIKITTGPELMKNCEVDCKDPRESCHTKMALQSISSMRGHYLAGRCPKPNP
jgi:hypothetical protein